MRIAYVTAGAAGMLCGSCLHDNTLAAAIRRQGHDIALIPTYTPIRTDETDMSTGRVFFGAVGVYLRARSPLFRHAPRFLDRVLDHPALLARLSGRKKATRASDLGRLAHSVLMGEEGGQERALRDLVTWLRDDFKPEIVHLTNSMFLGLAAPLKREMRVPVVCSVQGEDLFIDELVEPWKTRVVALMREKARDADLFIATGKVYADLMCDLLAIGREKMRVVSLGLNMAGYGGPRPDRADGPIVIGYLARISPEKGFHLLAEAFRLVARRAGSGNVVLRAAGYLGPKDRPYFEDVKRRIGSWGLAGSFEYLGEPDKAGKIEFLRGLDILSVPTIYRESKGLSVLEAMANGVPVVQPAHGSFPEIIERTGGGVLFAPGSAEELAAVLETLMRDPARRRALGDRGREAVARLYSDEVMARETVAVYLSTLSHAGGK